MEVRVVHDVCMRTRVACVCSLSVCVCLCDVPVCLASVCDVSIYVFMLLCV